MIDEQEAQRSNEENLKHHQRRAPVIQPTPDIFKN
jgi:hypothetical protein